MKNIIFVVAVAAILSGCIAKKAAPFTYYELSYKRDKCTILSKIHQNIYIDNVSATNLVDNRSILVVDYKNRIRHLDDAKFVTMPSEMVYKALVDAVFSQCKFNPIFAPKEGDLKIKTTIMALQVSNDQAVFTIGYELLNGYESKKSGIITKNIFVKDPSSQTIFNSMNLAMNQAIKELMKELER